jgi:hypothetical protein
MIKVQKGNLGIKPIVASVGATIFAFAFSVPALAVTTAPVPNDALARIAYSHAGKYDRKAPLAGLQYAGDVQPLGGEDAEHMRQEQKEQEAREETRRVREADEEHAERRKDRAEERHAEHEMDKAEHERHEAEQHRADQYPDAD